jgi:hypothetical protein
LDTDSIAVYENCIFRNNTAEYGGALEVFDTAANVTNCLFEDNKVGPGRCVALSVQRHHSFLFVRQSFDYLYKSRVTCRYEQGLILAGAAVFFGDSYITGTKFINNHAVASGGAGEYFPERFGVRLQKHVPVTLGTRLTCMWVIPSLTNYQS